MAAEHDTHDDLYRYDGYETVTAEFMSNPDVPQLRHDSGVDFETMTDAIHNETVGTLFISQVAVDVP